MNATKIALFYDLFHGDFEVWHPRFAVIRGKFRLGGAGLTVAGEGIDESNVSQLSIGTGSRAAGTPGVSVGSDVGRAGGAVIVERSADERFGRRIEPLEIQAFANELFSTVGAGVLPLRFQEETVENEAGGLTAGEVACRPDGSLVLRALVGPIADPDVQQRLFGRRLGAFWCLGMDRNGCEQGQAEKRGNC